MKKKTKSEVEFFSAINIGLPQARIYSRLGYVWGKTRLGRKQKADVDEKINEAVSWISLQGAAREIEIERMNRREIYLPGGRILKSASLARLFFGCERVLFIAATSGKKIMREIDRCLKKEEPGRAIIYDAAASEITDAALGWIEQYCQRELRRRNLCLLSRRFSAGYGDFDLENQKLIFEMLNLKKLGIRITPYSQLIPEKSVTAVCGIKRIKK